MDQRETSHPLSFVRELVIWKRRFNMKEHICIHVWEWNNGRGCENSVAIERDPLFRYFRCFFHISHFFFFVLFMISLSMYEY